MKLTVLVILIICLTSCRSEDSFNGYYYMKDSYDIYNFDKNHATVFDVLDSTIHKINYKILDKDIIEINDINYHYENLKDSLIIHGFPESYSSKRKSMRLIKFNFEEEISINDLNTKSWRMVVESYDRELDKKFNQTQIITCNDNLNAYYIKDNDTVLGEKFENNGKLFDKFIGFKRSDYRIVIPIEMNITQLKLLQFTGLNTNTILTLDKIDKHN